MKNNYLHYTFFATILLLFFCIPNQIFGNEKSNTRSSKSSENLGTTKFSFLTNSISFISSAVHTSKVGFMAEADSFKFLDEEFGCYVEMPTLQVDGTCVQASEAPNSYGDEVEFMWLERRNDEYIPLTDWSTNTVLNFCPDTVGYYRMCARTVGCTDIYEATEVYVTEICTITVDAGNDIDVCKEDSIVLTATTENENTCIGSCVYPIIESDRCAGGNPSQIWMSNSGNNFFNTTIHSNFEILEDGTAIYESQVFNGTDTLDVHITFTGRTTTAPEGSPKLGCETNDTSEYVYWTTTTGTIVSENHGTYEVTRMGEAFQLGIGGDVTRTGLGASGWFYLTGGDGFYTSGDVNIKLGECVPSITTNSVVYAWTTTDGNIVGNANQQSITVNQSGIYKVKVKDCKECEATDEVTVTVSPEIIVDAGDDIEICKATEIALTASAAVNRNTYITNSYKVTDGDTNDKSCFPTKGTGVLFTRGDGCVGSHDIWQAGDDLIFNEYSNGTAIIKGSLNRNGTTAELYIKFSNKETSGNTWNASCYLDNIADNQAYYQEFSGTLSYDGTIETIIKKASEQHFITADGAGFEAGQFGLGGWLGGSVGACSEWFANLTPIEIEECEISYLWSNGETTQTILVNPEVTTTYAVTATSCDTCIAADEVTVTVSSGITVDAGDDVEVCQEESVELSASAESTKECVVGCEYPIIESERCAGADVAEIWMMNDGTNMFNTTLNSSFKVFDDGTATYVSKVSNGTDIVDVNILFTGRTTIAPEGSPKLGCDTDDASGYVYYTNTSGTVISQNHGTFEVSRMGEAFQLGIGGDVARTGFGASGWFYLSGGDGHYEHGDVNIKLGECVTVSPTANIDYVWTTEDGNIVGEANQESITVNESGTYKIVAKDCKNCEAEDEVKVTITNPQAGKMTADVGTICLNNDVVIISATSNGGQNIPADYTQAYVLTSGDNLIIQGLSTNPEFEVSASGKYTIHSFVYPTSFDPLSVVTVGTTTGSDVNNLLIQGGGSLCASLDVEGAMVIVNDKIVLGDFVWIDENQNGLQDNGETGINGITATLFQNDGTEVASTTTANDLNTGEPGAYQFEVCPNSGQYYVVFNGLPNGFEITTQNAGNDELDSDINNNGRTDTFNVLDESILTIDAGIYSPCDISPEISAVDSICAGEEVILTATGGDIFQWRENGSDIQGATSATLSVFPTATITYSVLVTDSAQFECSGEFSKEIIVYELPTAIAGEDVAICMGQEITLTATGGDSYLWSNGETTNSIIVSPQATTEYSVTISSAQGCKDADTVVVTVNELPLAHACEDQIICYGDGTVLTAEGGDFYLWSTGETTSTITVSPEVTTEYSVTVSSAQGCEDTDTVVVTVNELPTAIAGEDVTICVGEEITLNATGGATYLWSNGETTSSITVAPESTTEYGVIVTSEAGCEDMDTVTVTVNHKVTIGDFVFEDMNGDGFQNIEDTGINGVTVKLFECDSFYGNAHGNLVDTCVTTYNPSTGNSGYYSFDVCSNSGPYYIIFEDIPTGYNFTSQESAAVDLDSNVNLDGVTACFDVTNMDNTTIDAGLKAETCGMGIGSKVLPRDPQGLYTVRNTDEACIGDDFYLWLFLDQENLSNYTDYKGEDMEGWSFTYEFPNGTIVTQDNSTNNSYRTQVYSLTGEDFGTYKISWTSPEGCNGLTSFNLSLAQECLKHGSRSTALPMIAMVYPVPALAISELSIVINTVNQSVEDIGNETIQAYGLQALLPQEKETVDAILYDTNGKIVGASKTFEVDRGRALVKYPLGNLATGNYILLISGKDWSDSKQIIIE